jgi:hypothetical protein
MLLLKRISLTVARFIRQTMLLPQSVATGFRHWRRAVVPSQAEAERLDRIRNPSKYLGK